MKTIEITIGGHKAQFTTKSLTIGGRELLYANMSQISHDPANHVYRFTYEGRKIALPYEAKDARVMTAIFTQVQALEAQKMSWTQALSGIHPNENPQPAAEKKPAAPVPEAAPVEKKPAEATAQPAAENKDEAAAQHEAGFNVKAQVEAQEPQTSESTSDNAKKQLSESADASVTPDSETSESETSDKEEKPKKSIKERFALKKKEKAADSEASEAVSEEKEPMDPEKKAKLKKSLKIFAIILAAVIALSAVYYFVFGTSKAPSDAGSNNTESQQYDDIDQLIDDMQ